MTLEISFRYSPTRSAMKRYEMRKNSFKFMLPGSSN